MSKSPKVIIIGAGIAGLTAAFELAHHGIAVTVIDKNARPGGKIRQIDVGGALIDSGPTVFTMRWIFEKLFEDCDEDFTSEFQLEALDILALHSWGDNYLDLYADKKKSADAIAEFCSPKQAQLFLEFCSSAKKVYESLRKPFIESQRPGDRKSVV